MIQHFTRTLSIRTKLILAFSLIGISITVLVNYMNYTAAKQLLQEEVYNKLIAVREIKKKQIQEFIEEKVRDITTLAHGNDVRILFEHLVQYHTDTLVGPLDAYDVSTPAYADIVDSYGTLLSEYIEMYGYRNIYLLCAAHGHVMYTASKGKDSGTNLHSGPFRESALAELWSRVVKTRQVVLEDFQPYAPLQGQPVAFIGTPITSRKTGKLIGVVSLQISVEELNNIMLQRTGLGRTGETYLVGSDRRMRSDSVLEPERYSVETSFKANTGTLDSEAIRNALNGETGIALIENYREIPVLSAYSTLDVLGIRWALLAEIDEKEAFAAIKTLRDKVFLWGGFFVGIVIIGAVFFAQGIILPLKTAVEFANQVSEGNLDVTCDISSHDEVGQVLMAMQNMIVYLQDVAKVAEKISHNDLHVEIHPKSEQDTLNHSLIKMVANLQTMTRELERSMTEIKEQYRAIKDQNWSKDGLSRLSAALAGDHSLRDLCGSAIRFIARYVAETGKGVLYTYNREQESLSLQGAFAFTERDRFSNQCKLGEGVIGQVALERSPILLKHLSPEERVIASGTISEAPLNTYTVPLLYNNELYGVLELASFKAFDEKSIQFLSEASGVIATALFSALQKEQTRELLRLPEQNAHDSPKDKEDE